MCDFRTKFDQCEWNGQVNVKPSYVIVPIYIYKQTSNYAMNFFMRLYIFQSYIISNPDSGTFEWKLQKTV